LKIGLNGKYQVFVSNLLAIFCACWPFTVWLLSSF